MLIVMCSAQTDEVVDSLLLRLSSVDVGLWPADFSIPESALWLTGAQYVR